MKTWFITGASRGFGALFVKEAPLWMPFGSDTVATIEAKNAFVAAELSNWRTLAISTDFAK